MHRVKPYCSCVHQYLLQPHQIFVIDGTLEGIVVKSLALQQLGIKLMSIVHITQRYFSVSRGDPDVVLPVKQVQDLAIVCRKNQSGIVPIDRFIFVKTKYMAAYAIAGIIAFLAVIGLFTVIKWFFKRKKRK